MSNVKNQPASIRHRLLNNARGTNRPFNEIIQYYTIERFLYRLSKSVYADKFILKGALMFRAWGASQYRPTRDIDFLGFTTNELEAAARLFREICSLEVQPDGMTFDDQTVLCSRIKEDADYEGIRVNLTGYLGKARIPLQIDVGFGDSVYPAPIWLQYPAILDMPAPRLRGYPPESVVAEKFQAMVFLGSVNSRLKDFYDLWLLADQFVFDGQKLQEAISHTFKRRNTILPQEIPVGLNKAFATEKEVQWRAFIQRSHMAHAPRSLEDVDQVLTRLLLPLLESSASGKVFNGTWMPGGQWDLR